jgi:hypothetical protein
MALMPALAVAMLVFAISLALLVGRFIVGDDDGYGLTARGGVVIGLAAFALREFSTLVETRGQHGIGWFLAAVALSAVPLIDFGPSFGFGGRWVKQRRQARLAAAVSAAAEQPRCPFARVRLGRALLELGHVGPGIAALRDARARADAESAQVVSELIAKTKDEFLLSCPTCGNAVSHTALVCLCCYAPLSQNLLVIVLVSLARPFLGRAAERYVLAPDWPTRHHAQQAVNGRR